MTFLAGFMFKHCLSDIGRALEHLSMDIGNRESMLDHVVAVEDCNQGSGEAARVVPGCEVVV